MELLSPSVSVECARQCPLGEVYAVEMKDEALDLIRRNAERFHALNLRVVPGRAPEVLSAPWGTRLAHRLSGEALRKVFALFLLLVGLTVPWSG